MNGRVGLWVAALGLGAVVIYFFVLRPRSFGAAGGFGAGGTMPPRTAAPSGGGIQGTIAAINSAGCNMALGSKGVPNAMSSAYCGFIQPFTPLAQLGRVVGVVSHPLDSARSVGSAVASGAKKVASFLGF